MNAPKRPTMPNRPSRPSAPVKKEETVVDEVEVVEEATSQPSAPAKPNRPGRPVVKQAPAVEEDSAEDDTVGEEEVTGEEYVSDDTPADDQAGEEETVAEEAAAPAPKKPGRPAAAKPAAAAEKAPKKAKEPKPTKEKEVKVPGERRLASDALLEAEHAQVIVDSVMQREDGESHLKEILSNFETDAERYEFFAALNREMNDYTLAILANHSVGMFHNDVEAGIPVFKRVAPGKDVVRNPSSTEFPANLVEGRVTVFLQRNGIPLRAVEGTSTRLNADQAAAEKDALKAK